MKAIIPVAGYATRLYPLTLNTPKCLLPIAGKPVINYILKKLQEIGVEDVYVVSNNKFYQHLCDWKEQQKGMNITIVNDQTNTNEERLGTIGDINYAVQKHNIQDDVFVLNGDNIFDFSLQPMYDMFKQVKQTVASLYDVKDIELAKQFGIVAIDENHKVTYFKEKPEQPPSTLASIGFYIYDKATVPKLATYVQKKEGDTSGHFIEYLVEESLPVYGYVYEQGTWFDIGNKQQLEEADAFMRKLQKT